METRPCRVWTLSGLKTGTAVFLDDVHTRVTTDDGKESGIVSTPLARFKIDTLEPIYFC